MPTPSIIAGSSTHTKVQDWIIRVRRNGGSNPSWQTVNALSNFAKELDGSGLMRKMNSINCFVPDNLIACTTPLIQPSNAPGATWTNVNFVASDLTINGLKGDGSSKYLNCGFTGTTVWPDMTNFGLSVCCTGESANQTGREIGVCNNSAPEFVGIYTGWSDNFSYGQGNGGGAGDFVSAGNSGSPLGFFSFSRTSTNFKALYKGKSSGGFSTLGSNSSPNSSNTVPSNRNFTMFIVLFEMPANLYYSSKRLSFGAIHFGLDNTESFKFYNSVQTMRRQLGGGTV